jgi:murein DD-endopeptidase MepM/ murein hydrolase activator NlpD
MTNRGRANILPKLNRILTLTAIIMLLPFSAWADLNLPVSGSVTSRVGWRLDPFGSGKLVYHRGTDIAVPVGTPVRATREGRVVHAGIHGGHGTAVIVEHENGDRTLYGHNSALTVQRGERVEAGTIIALSGNTGRSTGPHVHYEVMPGGWPVVQQVKADNPAKRRYAAGDDVRHKERRMDEIMDSILNRIGSFSELRGNAGQGG